MTDTLTIGNVEAPLNSYRRGAITTGKNFDGRSTEIPILVCRGKEEGPKLWLNGATHGDEPEGALSIFKTFEWLQHSLIKGTVVGVPAMNCLLYTSDAADEGFRCRSRWSPYH